jgi:SRSO17 transposase
MERRFAVRFEEMMSAAEVKPRSLNGALERLEAFIQPFAASLRCAAQRQHAYEYVAGLVSNVERKNVESIAYLHDQDRQPLQKFIGQRQWVDRPLIGELVRQVGASLGEADGVLVFDPSGFPKRGQESVGVARQWCGRLGKTDNCQVAIYLTYASRKEHALVDTRLYLPKEWTRNRRRCRKAGVPKEVRFQIRHDLALEMLDEHSAALPHAWIAGDDEMGRSGGFRDALRARGEHYLLAVPSNTLVRDLDASPPVYSGRGPHPKVPFQRVDGWCRILSEAMWTTIEIRPGEKGPLVVEAVKARVQTKRGRSNGPEETLVVLRERQADQTMKHDYYLSNAPFTTPLNEFVRVAKAEHRVEESLQRGKGEAGLSHYEVRTWEGWHHHQTLALIATWFLTQEKRRGEKGLPLLVGPPRTRDDWANAA